MDESFDPYRKWLGIPPEEQPPHHYRLLGLELFEGDADVIVNAADSRLSFLQSLSKDKNAEMAERIAAQIKDVQRCLLDPAKKAFYDGQLQRRMAALKNESSSTSSTLPNVAANGSSATPSAEFSIPELRIPNYSKPPARQPLARWQLLAAMTFGLIAVACFLVFLLLKLNPTEGNASKMAVQSKPIEKSPTVKPDRSISPVPSTANNSATKTDNPFGENSENSLKKNNSDNAEKPPIDSNSNPFESAIVVSNAETKTNVEEPPPTILDPIETPSEEDRPVRSGRKGSSTFKQDSTGRQQPIPAEAAMQAAEKTVRELYAMKIVRAKTSAQKSVLSDQIWSQALNSKNDAAMQYALMTVSLQLLGDAGRLQRAMDRAEKIADYFDVEPWELKLEVVSKVAKIAVAAQASHTVAPNIDGDELVLFCRQFAEEAKDAGKIDIADKTVKAVMPLAKRDPLLLREMNIFSQEIKRLVARYQPVRKALETLKNQPDDADANAVAGRWICFESRDWERGLSMLAKSSDPTLAEIAAKDIATAEDAEQALATADAWWDFGQKEKDKSSSKTGAISRAEYWYELAQPKLSGENKLKADARLKSIAGGDGASPSDQGVIQTGNVALAKNGTRVEGVQNNANKLFDGESKNPQGDYAAANSPVPCEWTITFDKVYRLQEIRFHFYDADSRFYRYSMTVSSDGTNYKPLIDRSQGQSFRWQTIPINGMPVKSVKLYGTFSYRNHPFSITEFEAYCIPPKK